MDDAGMVGTAACGHALCPGRGIWEEESHFKGQDPQGPRGPGGRTNSVYLGISPHVPCVTLLSAPDGALAAHVEWLWRAGRSSPESQRCSVEF